MINIRDKVRSKGVLAPVQTGTLMGLVLGSTYKATYGKEYSLVLWDETFPGWEDKYVYIIKKDLSIPSIHVQDDDCPCCVHNNAINPYFICPEEDIELYDWVEEIEKSL